MILIAGCSWGVGELIRQDLWNHTDMEANINHKGLEQYLIESGKSVKNLSIIGNSNTGTCSSLEGYVERYGASDIEEVYVFQTEYTRDYQFKFDEDYDNLTNFFDLSGIFISRFYHRLSRFATANNVRINLIGGVSDIPWVNEIEETYPGLKVACQSLTNLILNNDHNIDKPVISLYRSKSFELVNDLKKILGVSCLPDLTEEIDRGWQREMLFIQHPEYFYPDGVHPNRYSYKILYDFLFPATL